MRAQPLNAPFESHRHRGRTNRDRRPERRRQDDASRAILAAVEESRGGERPEDAPVLVAGSIVVGKNTRVAYLDQARAGLDDTKSIFDDVRGESGGTIVHLGVRGLEAMDLRSYLELFLFDAEKQRQKVGSLSGGERARVALAKVLRERANLLVFDEPTNDSTCRRSPALEEMLTGYEGSAIVVTHDRAFLDRVATAILAFEWDPGGPLADREGVRDRVATVTRYAGGYQDYVTQRANRSEAKKAPAPVAAIAAPKPPPKDEAKRGLTYAERIELAGIVPAVDEADKRVHELEAELADPALYAKRGHDVANLKARLEGARAEAARLMARWEALEAKR